MKKRWRYSLILVALILPAFFYHKSEVIDKEDNTDNNLLALNSYVYFECKQYNLSLEAISDGSADGLLPCSNYTIEAKDKYNPRLEVYNNTLCYQKDSISGEAEVFNIHVDYQRRASNINLGESCQAATVKSCVNMPKSIWSLYDDCNNMKITSKKNSTDNVNNKSGGSYTFILDLVGLSSGDIDVKIYNSSNTDVTKNFTITKPTDSIKVDIAKNTAKGKYTIKFSYDTISTTDSFEIIEAVETVLVSSIKISGASEVYKGKTISLSAAVSPSNASNKSVTWSSSNSAIATVDQNGTVKGIATGSVTITATSADGSNVKATKAIKVLDSGTTTTTTTTKKTTTTTTTTRTTTTTTKVIQDDPNDNNTNIDNPSDLDKDQVTTTTTTKKTTRKEQDKENNPDTGIRDVTIVLVLITFVSVIAVLYIKKYNLFKKF